MREIANAYFAQAISDLDVFLLLADADRIDVPECHPLHYLQMATEKLAKAITLRLDVDGFDRFSHVAFSLLPGQLARGDLARRLGYERFDAYAAFLRKARPIFRQIDELNPAVGARLAGGGGGEGPNVEYPWPGRDAAGVAVWRVPARESFGLLATLRDDVTGAQVLRFIRLLAERFDDAFKDA